MTVPELRSQLKNWVLSFASVEGAVSGSLSR